MRSCCDEDLLSGGDLRCELMKNCYLEKIMKNKNLNIAFSARGISFKYRIKVDDKTSDLIKILLGLVSRFFRKTLKVRVQQLVCIVGILVPLQVYFFFSQFLLLSTNHYRKTVKQ